MVTDHVHLCEDSCARVSNRMELRPNAILERFLRLKRGMRVFRLVREVVREDWLKDIRVALI